MIRLNLLPPPAPIPTLAPPQFPINKSLINGNPLRHPFDQRNQRLPMRFARGSKEKITHAPKIISEQPTPVPLALSLSKGSLLSPRPGNPGRGPG